MLPSAAILAYILKQCFEQHNILVIKYSVMMMPALATVAALAAAVQKGDWKMFPLPFFFLLSHCLQKIKSPAEEKRNFGPSFTI